VRNTAHAELTWTAAGTVLPLSAVHQIVYTHLRGALPHCEKRQQAPGGDGYALWGLEWIPG
jgi:hypothetical protein